MFIPIQCPPSRRYDSPLGAPQSRSVVPSQKEWQSKCHSKELAFKWKLGDREYYDQLVDYPCGANTGWKDMTKIAKV